MRNETYIAYFKDNTTKAFYCKKNEIENYMTVAEYRKLDYIKQMNRASDKVNHKPFTI